MRRMPPLLVNAFLLLVLAAIGFAGPLPAQARAAGPAPASTRTLAAAPAELEALARFRTEARRPAEVSGAEIAVETARVGRGGRREAIALMIVGGAGVVTGLIADEDILVIAGAAVGGVGLYFYLR